MSDIQDRRLTDRTTDLPFDHEHYGDWVQMELVSTTEVVRGGWIRRVLTYSCPSCGYELSESTPDRAVDLRSA